ncbi:hypothetical protein HRbin40_00302 [bacterium HR40]|nr:hypothetical protein HRbin40_00302 [bacterium HR40]
MRANLLERRERRLRQLVRVLQVTVALLAIATGMLAWREATRPPSVVPRVHLPAIEDTGDVRILAATRASLERTQMRLRELEAERDQLVVERDQLRRKLAELEDRIVARAAERQPSPSAVAEASRTEEARARERGRRQQLWLHLLAVQRQLARLQAEFEAAGRRPMAEAAVAPPQSASAGARGGSRTSVGSGGRMPVAPGEGTRVVDGVEAYRQGDYERAFAIWSELAEAGVARAQFHLGAMLYEGRLGPPDRVQAYIWLERAVRGGDPRAAALRDRVRADMSEREWQRAREILDQ